MSIFKRKINVLIFINSLHKEHKLQKIIAKEFSWLCRVEYASTLIENWLKENLLGKKGHNQQG